MDIYVQLKEIEKKQDAILNLLTQLHDDGVVNNKEKIYDLTDLEEILHVSRRTLFLWKSKGKIFFSQIGKKLYITEAELKRFLESNRLT